MRTSTHTPSPFMAALKYVGYVAAMVVFSLVFDLIFRELGIWHRYDAVTMALGLSLCRPVASLFGTPKKCRR